MTRAKTNDPICDALDVLLDLDALTEIAALVRRAIHVAEVAPLFEQDAIRHERTAEWHAERGRYDLAAGERERAAVLRRRAKALRVLEAHRQALTKRAEQPPEKSLDESTQSARNSANPHKSDSASEIAV